MFTGIIENLGTVVHISTSGTNSTFVIESPISAELKVDQSIAHNGVCLTVEKVENNEHTVTAILETLQKTNLGQLQVGQRVNLERCMMMNGRLDGHIVQGHVDSVGTIKNIESQDGSFLITTSFNREYAHLLVEKGSICLNGISLTVFGVTESQFQVAIIPYTWQHTNLQSLEVGSTVNLEFDIVGKYVARMNQLKFV
ncbi:MAG: riboflavin synthase [Bacteroidetes bacterium]|nr:riboflavin synthase [Bacteroidota bacterium]